MNVTRTQIFENTTLLAVAFVLVAFLGFGAAYVVPNPYSVSLPLAVFVGTVVFVATSRSGVVSTRVTERLSLPVSWKYPTAAYLLLVSGSILAFHAAGNDRTLLVRALVLLGYVIALIFVFYEAPTFVTLSTIVLTGIVQRGLAYYASPTYLGKDIFFHTGVSHRIAVTGTLEPLSTSKYYYSPLYHVLSALSELLYGVSIRHAVFLTVTVAMVLVPACSIYVLLRRFKNPRVAALGALLYTSSDFAINWGLQPQATSLGVAFFALVFALFVTYVKTRSARKFVLFAVLLFGLTFVHQVSTFITVVFVTSYLVFYRLYSRRDTFGTSYVALVAGLVLFITFMTTHYGGPDSETGSFLVVVVGIFVSAILATEGGATRAAVELPQDPSIYPASSNSLTLVHVAGTAILLGLAVLGALYWISDRSERSDGRQAFAIGGIAAVAFPLVLVGPMVGIRQILPWRWFAFIYVPLVVLAAPGLASLWHVVEHRWKSATLGVVVLVLLVSPYLVVMDGNFRGSYDDPVFDSAPTAERYGLTTTEAQLFSHTSKYAPSEVPIHADDLATIVLAHRYDVSTETVAIEYGNPETLAPTRPALVVAREYIYTEHATYNLIVEGRPMTVHGPIPLRELSPASRSVVYSSGSDELVWVS